MSNHNPNFNIADFDITALKINRQEALRYLQLPSSMSEAKLPQDIKNQLATAEQTVLDTAQPRFIWRQFDIKHSNAAISLSGCTIKLTGNDIAAQLKNSSCCVLMAATIGIAVDSLIQRSQLTDMSKAIMLDAMASAAVENLCDQLQNALANHFAQQGLFITTRYSPGYGDLPISLQRELCDTLDTSRRIGLGVNSGGILLPRKSVTAIIGVGSTPHGFMSHCQGCDSCNMHDTCPYRKKQKI